jgi:acylphosphatase
VNAVRIIVSGHVHGVWFRAHTQRKARELGLVGSVRNVADGTVEILAEGDSQSLQDLVAWAWQGSPMARVENVVVDSVAPRGDYDSFDVTY